MRRFINKVTQTKGYQEQKVFFQRKIDAEEARIVHRYNEKQQAKAQLEAENAAPTIVEAHAPAAQQMADIDTTTVASPGVLQDATPETLQESTLATQALTAVYPLPPETKARTTNSLDAEIEIELFMLNTANAVDAINFDDSSDSDAQSVNAIALTAAEEV